MTMNIPNPGQSKMIRLSPHHYIVISGAATKSDRYVYDTRYRKIGTVVRTYDSGEMSVIIGELNHIGDTRAFLKITHSTEPIEQGYGSVVKDGVMLRNVGKDPCYDMIEHLSLLEVEEAMAAIGEKPEPSAENMMFTIKDMILAFEYGKTLEPFDSFGEFIKSRLSKSEWDVEFDNGKLIILNQHSQS